MARKKHLKLTKLTRLFKDFDQNKVIKTGTTSVICEHPIHKTMVHVYTSDKGKMLWFKEYERRFGFRFIEKQSIGSAHDEEPQVIYHFTLKRMYPLNEDDKKYLKNGVLNTFKSSAGFSPSMILFKLIRETSDMKLKDLFVRLRAFIDNNSVKFDLRVDSFMKMSDSSIVCVDPFYTTRER